MKLLLTPNIGLVSYPSGSIVEVIKKSLIGHSESTGTQNVKSLP